MNVLLLGGGGREHAMAWRMAQSPLLTRLIMMPGSDAMAMLGQIVSGDICDKDVVLSAVKDYDIDLVVVGPEAPLAAGVTNALRAHSIPTFGPSKEAAQLEASKAFTKDIAEAAGVPTAKARVFDDFDAARAYVTEQGAPIVIKADGLAAGKGVVVAMSLAEALAAIDDMASGAHGEAGNILVVEEYMTGDEVSLFVLVAGEEIHAFGSAQDHKRIHEGDQGPNTGGMGAYSPAPMFSPELEQQAMDQIVAPTIAEMARRNIPYEGVLFCGLMLTDTGPRLIEFNARFGDPECQALMMRAEGDLLAMLNDLAHSQMPLRPVTMGANHAITVVMAAPGYPGTPQKGSSISLPNQLGDGCMIFHAGTKAHGDQFLAQGGRVLNVTATGASLQEARDKAYDLVGQIDWPEGYARRDIGHRALKD